MVCKSLLRTLEVPFTQNFLKEKILTHPQYPSLLSISDTLEEYGVETMAVKLSADRLDEVPLPVIVQVALVEGSFFNVITGFTGQVVSLLDEKGNQKDLSKVDFVNIWTGVSLLVEAGENAMEPEISKRIQDQRIIKALASIGVIGFMGWMGISFAENGFSGLYLGYFLIKFLGLAISGMLLWYQEDRENPALQRFCSGGKSVDCNSVINLKAFQLLDGRINPSMLASAYFFAGLGLLLSTALSSITFLAWLSMSTIPVVFYSFYYQAMVIKRWCRFCLLIQAVLVMEVMTVIIGELWIGGHSISAIGFFTFLFTGIILGGVWIKPLLEYQNELYKAKRELGKLKTNKQLFQAALSQSKKIQEQPEGLGILFKGKAAKHHVIKVCNPYCGPCSRTHPLLDQLYEDGNIDLQILFLPGGGDEIRGKTISHLMGISFAGNQKQTRKALDDWYLPKQKDYDVFAAKYPLNGELTKQEPMIKAMQDWAEKEQITHTPTIFINGYELPPAYGVDDLKYVLQ